MGYRYDEAAILAAAVEAALEEGISRLTFGRLARRLEIADRSIVYYFPTKADLLTRTLTEIGAGLQAHLEVAFGDEPLPADVLVRRAWPVLSSPDADPTFSVFFEAVGLGIAGIEPFDSLAPRVIEGWIDWLTPRVAHPDPQAARDAAYSIVATLDGLLLVRLTCGGEAAVAAARASGIVD